MPSDPYAQYLTPPASAPPTGGSDPYAKYLTSPGSTAATAQPQHGALYNALFKEGTGGSGSGLNWSSADEGVLPALRDYGLAGLDDLLMGHGAAVLPTSLGSQIAQAHSNLGPMSPIVAGATYGLGPGKLLGAEGATAALAGRPIAQGAAEGALAGGISDFDPSDVQGSLMRGALGGAVLGGTAGSIGKGIGALGGMANRMTQPPIDPEIAVAATKEPRDALYGLMSQTPIGSAGLHQSLQDTMDGLDPSVRTGMSGTLNGKINDILGTLKGMKDQGIDANGSQVDSWQRQINDAAKREGYPTDNIVAGKLNDNLSATLDAHGLGELQDRAQEAHKRYASAQALRDLQQQLDERGEGPGNVPKQQAENYPVGSDERQAWNDIAQAGQSSGLNPAYVAGHWGADVGGDIGALVAGFPGLIIGKGLGYLGGKFLGKKAVTNWQNRGLRNAYQGNTTTLTGVQQMPGKLPWLQTGAQSPQVGQMIKNLMLGGAY